MEIWSADKFWSQIRGRRAAAYAVFDSGLGPANAKLMTRVCIQVERKCVIQFLHGLHDSVLDWQGKPCQTDRIDPMKTMYSRVKLASRIVMVRRLRPMFILYNSAVSFYSDRMTGYMH